MDARASKDSGDLAALGYKQKLDRPLGGFSSFAASFSYLSILTGTFQLFYVGYAAGGPAAWWTWPMTFAGQFLIALCFAEVAAHYPVAGGVYQWSKYVGSGAWGWMTGWVYLCCQIVTVSAVALAVQTTLPQIDSRFQFIGAAADAQDQARNAVILGCVVIALTTIVNMGGVKLLSIVNNLGVVAELTGAVLLIVLLLGCFQRGPSVVMDTQGRGVGVGYLGPFLAAALMSSYVMYGFENAGLLAEETRDPRKTAPRAILQALGTVSLLGGMLLLLGLMAAENLNDPALGKKDGGLPLIVKEALGGTMGKVLLSDVILAITVCALTVQTGAVRLIFGMARDNNLPFSRPLATISVRSKTPVAPAVLTGLLAALPLIVNFNNRKIIDAIIPASVVLANLAYLLVTTPLLLRRLRGWPGWGGSGAKGVFSLGRWGLMINAAAIVWGVFNIANIGWPRPDEDSTWLEANAAWLFSAVLILAGAGYYVCFQRRKTRILEDHRA
jgi:urea carboxylase system permease